jgi:L-asparaginase II
MARAQAAKAPQIELESDNPVIAHVLRAGHVETSHRGVVVAADFRGRMRFVIGDASQMIFPRSMLKPIMATALVASGAADRYRLTSEHVAMAAASHFGQDFHLALLHDWADRIGVKIEQLQCGVHPPFNKQAAASLVRLDQSATVFHNNNCGRHLTVLTIAKLLDVPLDGYLASDHPANRYCKAVAAKFLPSINDPGNDAIEVCGLPTTCTPIAEFAIGMAKLARPSGLDPTTADAASQVIAAMASHPTLVSGERRLTASLVQLTEGRLVVKGGSEGGQAAVDRETGVAVVVKTDDGTHPAAEIAFLEVLKRLSMLTPAQFAAAIKQSRQRIQTYAGDQSIAEVIPVLPAG